jgi:hypothetical protein
MLLFGVATNGVLIAGQQAVPPGTRVAYPIEGDRVPELLVPGDSAVLLKRSFPPLTVEPPAIQTTAEALSALEESDALVVMQVTRREGVLDDGQTWIVTRTTGRLVRVLRTGAGVTLQRGALLTAEEYGGTMRLKGVTVTTEDAPKEAVVVGAKYLVSLGRDPGKPLLNLNVVWRLDAQERVSVGSADASGDWRRLLAGMTVDEIAASIRKSRRQR